MDLFEFNKVEIKHINLDKTLSSGQSFVWHKEGEFWFGKTINGLIVLSQPDSKTIYWQTYQKKDNFDLVSKYLRLDFDYDGFLVDCERDKFVKKALEQYRGTWILQQDFFEMVISFIISTNKNITSIRKSIKKISELLGQKIVINEKEFYLFPEIEKIANADLALLKSTSIGYRAEYVKSTAQSLIDDEFYSTNLDSTEEELRQKLITLRGVGDKVADCVLCFGLAHDNVTPLDVWGKRFMAKYYGFDPKISYKNMREWTQKNFNGKAAWAGQYLFEMIRNTPR
jgi:N-glycosylase/DNA lyase